MDKLSESYSSFSPYAYVMNNPVMLIDPDGRASWLRNFWDNATHAGGPNGLSMQGDGFAGGTNPYYNYGYGGSYLESDNIHPISNGYNPFSSTPAYSALMDALQNDNTFGLQSKNGVMSWWTDIADTYDEDGNLVKGIGYFQMMKFQNVDWERTNKGLGAFGFGNDVKMQLIEYGVRQNVGLTLREFNALNKTAQEVRTLGALGYTGSKYLKFFKGAGVAASVVTTAYSSYKVYDQYQTGGIGEVLSHRDAVDATVGVIGLGSTALVAVGLVSNPVGWAIGAGVLLYGTGTLIYDAYTEH